MSLDELDLEVTVKLAVVDNSLAKVDEYRKQLQENARKLKDEIHNVVERQVGSLRGRERQLIRQVEVVTAHQNCLLSTQQAGLMHNKGALTATKDILNRCSPKDISTLSKIKMEDLTCTQHVSPVNLVSVHLNENLLNTTITGFGSVQLPETITHHPSPVIPAKIEDYEEEDGDHDVLHKSVAGSVSGPDSPLRITVNFPKIGHQNWLMKQKNKTSETLVQGAVKNDMREQSKCNITSWLSGLHLAGAQEEENLGTYDDFVVPNSDLISLTSSSPSSSIEIVSSHFDSDKDDCSTAESACEIENVPFGLEERSRWLSPSHSVKSDQKLLGHIKVSDACQANEQCADFSDCVCQGSCAKSALEKVKQTAAYQAKINRKRTFSESEDINVRFAQQHMAQILSSPNSRWLLKNLDTNSNVQNPAKKAMYESPKEKWLSQSSISDSNVLASTSITLSTHSNVWLLHKMKAEKDKLKEEKEVDIDEKENARITADDLSEAIKKIQVDVSKNNYASKNISKESSRFTNECQPWLLGKSMDSDVPIDNKLTEIQKSNQLQWLVHSNSSDFKAKLRSGKSSSSLPECLVAIAEADLQNWLANKDYEVTCDS